MIVALFGIACVGKSTVGKIISEKLDFQFFDLDDELRAYYNDTIINIQDSCLNRRGLDDKKIVVFGSILSRCKRNKISNAVIAVSPIYYTAKYKRLLKLYNVFSIELRDSPENIANRIIYTDDDDKIIENMDIDIFSEIKDTKYFISRYKKAFSWIENKYDINGKTAAEAADDIIDLLRQYL